MSVEKELVFGFQCPINRIWLPTSKLITHAQLFDTCSKDVTKSQVKSGIPALDTTQLRKRLKRLRGRLFYLYEFKPGLKGAFGSKNEATVARANSRLFYLYEFKLGLKKAFGTQELAVLLLLFVCLFCRSR